MYRCSECGCEYEIKPDYCDCGNDIFVEVSPVETVSQVNITPQVEPTYQTNNTYIPKNSYTDSNKNSLDVLSIIIFVTCIILSIMSFIFIKPSENIDENIPKEQPKVPREVADIESFWNDTPPKREDVTPIEDKTIANQIKNVIDQTVSSVQQVKPVNDQKSNKVVTPIKKPVETKQNSTVSKNNTVKKTQTSSKPISSPPTKNPTSVQTNPVQQTIVPSKQPASQPNVVPKNSQNTVSQVILSIPSMTLNVQELNNYKNSLRDTVGRRIDFTKVYGDGVCVVSFKVDSNGRLINKKFETQSSNNTLNDEVFKAVQGVPVYKAPPSSYNGQVMKLTVKYSNGRYSVALN